MRSLECVYDARRKGEAEEAVAIVHPRDDLQVAPGRRRRRSNRWIEGAAEVGLGGDRVDTSLRSGERVTY